MLADGSEAEAEGPLEGDADVGAFEGLSDEDEGGGAALDVVVGSWEDEGGGVSDDEGGGAGVVGGGATGGVVVAGEAGRVRSMGMSLVMLKLIVGVCGWVMRGEGEEQRGGRERRVIRTKESTAASKK